MMDLECLNVAEVCRTCKCISPNMRSLFEGYENILKSPRIDEMLMACASVQVIFGDGLPSQICHVCMEQLRSAFVFKCQCEKIDASLRECIKNSQVIEIKEELENSEFMDADIDDHFEPQVDVIDSVDKIKEVADIGYQDDESLVSEETAADNNTDIDNSLDEANNESQDMVKAFEEGENLMEIKVEEKEPDLPQFEDGSILDHANDDNSSSGDNTDSEYLPKKASLKVKRDRGISLKNFTSLPNPTKVKESDRGKNHPPKNIEADVLDEEYGEFPCPDSQEILTTMSQLDKHTTQNHEGLKIHKCPVCNKEYNRANHLKRHVSSHSRVKSFQCSICRKSMSRRDHLAKHQKLHEEYDFVCDICQKLFSRVDYLTKHKFLKHGIGEVKDSKNYLCPECGKGFSRKDYLAVHLRRHRGEKPFKCKYCDKGFTRSTDVTIHERYHTGEKTHLCTVCGRGFGRFYNFKVHMRTHTGEKPYKCTYCDAAFAQGTDLKTHIRRHTGERFQCELCTDNFFTGSLLTQHKRNVHGVIVTSNTKRLQRVQKLESPADLSPISTPLPKYDVV